MLPVHMACLNGYSNCVENLLSTGKYGLKEKQNSCRGSLKFPRLIFMVGY